MAPEKQALFEAFEEGEWMFAKVLRPEWLALLREQSKGNWEKALSVDHNQNVWVGIVLELQKGNTKATRDAREVMNQLIWRQTREHVRKGLIPDLEAGAGVEHHVQKGTGRGALGMAAWRMPEVSLSLQ